MPDIRSLSRSTIESRMLIAQTTGASINVAFPTIKLLAAYQFTKDTGLVGLTISSSIVNVSTSVAGAFVAQGQGNVINLTQSDANSVPANIFISQITHQNSTAGTIAPAARTNSLAFGEATSIIPMRAGSSIAIYGSLADDGGGLNLFAAALSIYTITL
jgi:hypothetical protein